MRLSNIELLRIISMIMILAVHAVGASAGLPSPGGDLGGLSIRDIFRLSAESFAIIGVNCFTMISGYFGIRLRWRTMASFLFECLFYSFAVYLTFCAFFPRFFKWQTLLDCGLVLTHTDLWYVPAYFFLMAVSPILNEGANSLGKRRFGHALLLLLAINLWCGWLWGGKFNPTGYTVVQLATVYLIARYIMLYVRSEFMRNNRGWLIVIYLFSTAAIFATSLFLPSGMAFAYNSPAVMLASISFFIIFTTFSLSSAPINHIAKSCFAVYLIHKAPVLWGNFIRPHIAETWADHSLTYYICCTIIFCILIFAVAMIVDPLRRLLSRKLLKN